MHRRLLACLALLVTVPLAACAADAPVVLVEGDCLLISGVGESGDRVPVVACAEPHEAEVYATLDLPTDALATDPYAEDVVLAAAEEACIDRFEAYVGEPYRTSPLDIFTTYPRESGWEAGERRVVCAVFAPDPDSGAPVLFEGTLEDSA